MRRTCAAAGGCGPGAGRGSGGGTGTERAAEAGLGSGAGPAGPAGFLLTSRVSLIKLQCSRCSAQAEEVQLGARSCSKGAKLHQRQV